MIKHNFSQIDELGNKFENVFVYHDHIFPLQGMGTTNEVLLSNYQEKSVILDRGINIKFGEQLKEILLRTPVLFSYNMLNNITTPTPYSKEFLSTYNTGTRPIERNERIAVVPPMCDCLPKFKIKGIIPLQTVSHVQYSAALNNFINWMRGVNLLKSKMEGNFTLFPKVLSIAYEHIKTNYLVQEMMAQIKIPDGNHKSKIETLYEIVHNHWLTPLLGSNGMCCDGLDIQSALDLTIRALNDMNPEFTLLFQLLERHKITNEELQNEVQEKLKAIVINILNIPKYYEMLTQYMSPQRVPIVGIICTSFDDPFYIYPRKKMIIKKI